jgi:DNA-binding response OmpR family regulator
MNILVIHNNNEFLYLIIDVLKCAGHMPMKAADLKEAREVLEMDKLDLFVADGSRDHEDGLRFHSYVREFSDCSEVPFVFITDGRCEPISVEPSSVDIFFDSAEGAVSILDMIEPVESAGNRLVAAE